MGIERWYILLGVVIYLRLCTCMEYKNTDFLIDDGYGNFVDFDRIRRLDDREIIMIRTDGGCVLQCTPNHLVEIANNTFIRASSVKVGTMLSNGQRAVYIAIKPRLCAVYDIAQSETGTYLTNNLVSHNCSFVGSSNTLIDSNTMQRLTYDKPLDERGDVRYFEYPTENHIYAMTVDVSRGRGLDYTAFSIIDVTNAPYKVVCSFKNNTIDPSVELPILLNKLGTMYNKALILVENNDLGEAVGLSLWTDWEYDNVIWTDNNRISGHGVIGVKTTRKVKQVGTNTLKLLIENDQIVLRDFRYLEELSVFVRMKAGLYGAQDHAINDDLTATLWLFAWLTTQSYFTDYTNSDIGKNMINKHIEGVNEYLPMGFFVDGINDTENDVPLLTDDQLELLR